MNYAFETVIDWYSKNRDKISEMYRIVKIPKRNGKVRTLEIPNPLIDSFQRTLQKGLSYSVDCSIFAEAYQEGKSIKNVAYLHANKKLLLKLDIKDFFGRITVDLIKNKVFNYETGDILAELCCCNEHLPQGACTSPIISNLVMKDFDNELGKFCAERNITFSRYSDDMIFSGDFNPGLIIRKVRELLRKSDMEINDEKTVIAGRGSRQMVLGVVVNEKIQLSSDYRRKIRQEVYYCSKYGVKNHIVKSNSEKYIIKDEQHKILWVNTTGYLRSLMGKINYALYINPNDSKMIEYRESVAALWQNCASDTGISPESIWGELLRNKEKQLKTGF